MVRYGMVYLISKYLQEKKGEKTETKRDKRASKTGIFVDHRLSKNQLVRLLPVSWAWTVATGSFPPPPPRRGFAMREPTKLKPLLLSGRPFVEPCLAASRRSLTAVSWASKLLQELN
jgi:hypothetical protein